MDKKTVATISLCSGILWVFVQQSLFLTVRGLYPGVTQLLSGLYATLGDQLFRGFVDVVCATAMGIFIYQLLSKRVEIVFLCIVGAGYLYALFTGLFMRTPGIRGLNLSLAEFGTQFSSTPMEMMWNVLMLLPVGIVVQLLTKKTWKTALIGLVVVIMIEGTQYIFSVGVFDVVDIILNVTGILMGAFIISSSALEGWHMARDRHYLSYTK